MKNYYDALSINESASIDEIKRAYRKKAKQLHPDVNKSVSAEQDFIAINQAYEFVINIKLGLKYDSRAQKFNRSGGYGKVWNDSHQQEARKRAEYYSRKKYSDFINSRFYKEGKLIDDFIHVIELTFYFLFIFVFPITISFWYDFSWIWGSILIAFLTVHSWGPQLVNKRFPPITHIKEGFVLTLRSFRRW